MGQRIANRLKWWWKEVIVHIFVGAIWVFLTGLLIKAISPKVLVMMIAIPVSLGMLWLVGRAVQWLFSERDDGTV